MRHKLFFPFFFLLGSLLAAEQSSMELLLQNSKDYFQDRKYDKAQGILEKAIYLYPESERKKEAYSLLSQTYGKLNLFSRALDTELTLYRMYPESEEGMEALLRASDILEKMGREKEALQFLDKIKKISFSSRYIEEANQRIEMIQTIYFSKEALPKSD